MCGDGAREGWAWGRRSRSGSGKIKAVKDNVEGPDSASQIVQGNGNMVLHYIPTRSGATAVREAVIGIDVKIRQVN